MMHFNPHAGEPLDFSESAEQRATRLFAFWQRLEAIERAVAKPPRQPARHRWQPMTQACIDCGVSRLINDAVSYGYWIPCQGEAEKP